MEWPLAPNQGSLQELLCMIAEISSLAWKDLVFCWKAEWAEGCVFFLLLSILFQKKQVFIYKELIQNSGKIFRHHIFCFKCNLWSFLCLGRKQLHLCCTVVCSVTKEGEDIQRSPRQSYNSPMLTKHRRCCLFFNIPCICSVPFPTRTLSCHCKLKDKHGFVSSVILFIFQKCSAVLIILLNSIFTRFIL